MHITSGNSWVSTNTFHLFNGKISDSSVTHIRKFSSQAKMKKYLSNQHIWIKWVFSLNKCLILT